METDMLITLGIFFLDHIVRSFIITADAHAAELAERLRGMLCHVNLIPVNAVEGKAQRRSSRERIRSFMDILEKKGINTTVRRTLGSDINASCGQLRRQQDQREDTENTRPVEGRKEALP